MQLLEFRAMGSRIRVILDSASPTAAAHLSAVPHWFAEWEQCLSRFRADSELNRLNRSGGQAVPVSPVLWDVLYQALSAAQQSAGLVTPTLLSALEAAGYTASFDKLHPEANHGRHGQLSIAAGWVASHDWRAIECDPENGTVRIPAGMRLDLGGTAKGWAAHQTMQRLAAHGPVLVDAGGDIAVSGPQRDGSPWPIGISDPVDPARQPELLLISGGGVATSGRDYRRWQQHGTWQHHLIDPRTGQPAATNLLSATVVAASVCAAEMAAKVTLLLGSNAACDWVEARPELAALLVREDGQMLHSRRLPAYLWHDERD